MKLCVHAFLVDRRQTLALLSIDSRYRTFPQECRAPGEFLPKPQEDDLGI